MRVLFWPTETCLVLNPLKNYLFRCLSLGHMARPGVKGLISVRFFNIQTALASCYHMLSPKTMI